MDINKIFDFMNKIGTITESGEVVLAVFIQLVIALVVYYFLRMALIFKSAKIHFFKERKFLKQKAIILNHIGIEIIINFIVSFLLLIIMKTSNNNIIVNMVFAPLLGQVIAILIDDWYIIPKEKDSIYHKFNKKPDIEVNSVKDIAELHGMLDMGLADKEEFRPVIIQTINDIKKEQEEHAQKIDDISNKCDVSMNCLNKLQKAAMNDKKIALKDEIYECLNAGFVTPKQRDKITLDYESYCELGGNHEVQKLYEEHFLNLSVHEDRRKKNVSVDQDRRSNEQRVLYGEFDKEAD